MIPITGQAAVDDEVQRPLLQDVLEAAIDGRRQAAVDVEEQRPLLQEQDIFEAAVDGHHVRENSRGGFPLPSLRFLLSSVLLLHSGLQFYHRHIHAELLSETAMLPPSCHGGPGTLLCLRTIVF